MIAKLQLLLSRKSAISDKPKSLALGLDVRVIGLGLGIEHFSPGLGIVLATCDPGYKTGCSMTNLYDRRAVVRGVIESMMTKIAEHDRTTMEKNTDDRKICK